MTKKQIVSIILFILGLAILGFAFSPGAKKSLPIASPLPSASPLSSYSASPLGTWVATSLPSPTANSPTPTPASPGSPAPSPSPVNQQIQVNLSINGSQSFAVNVDEGNNQCDVLSKALEQGKIQSLNMQFNNSLGSYAVYQINGLGKENTVWWTYKVNGQSPTQGCSYIKTNNNDHIEWQYIGS